MTARTAATGGVPRIALLEDDASQAKLVQHWIASQGYACRPFHSGEDILRSALRDTYDLIILDWRVPDLSGEEVLRALRRSAREHVPVLFTTGQNREEDIVHALRNGADDYLVKPLRRLEFLARVEALLRRAPGRARETLRPLQAGAFQIDPAGRTVLRDGVPIELTHKEFEIALLLFRNVGRLLSRDYLLDTVWGINTEVGTRTVDTHASQLRTKLGLYPEHGWRLSAVYQHGYRLEQLAAPLAGKQSAAPRRGRRQR